MAATEDGRMTSDQSMRTVHDTTASQQVLRPSPDLRGLRPVWPGGPLGQGV